MIITIGSTNIAKIQAVKECIDVSHVFTKAQLIPISVDSEVSEQPMTLSETIRGAKNRARNAFLQKEGCAYGFGIESGLMESEDVATGFVHICIGSIFDGENYYIGSSVGFEIPPMILELIFEKNMNLSQACINSGISNNVNIGSTEGLIGVLTKGRIDRKEYSKQCIAAAIMQLENKTWYSNDVSKFGKTQN